MVHACCCGTRAGVSSSTDNKERARVTAPLFSTAGAGAQSTWAERQPPPPTARAELDRGGTRPVPTKSLFQALLRVRSCWPHAVRLFSVDVSYFDAPLHDFHEHNHLPFCSRPTFFCHVTPLSFTFSFHSRTDCYIPAKEHFTIIKTATDLPDCLFYPSCPCLCSFRLCALSPSVSQLCFNPPPPVFFAHPNQLHPSLAIPPPFSTLDGKIRQQHLYHPVV